MHKIKVEKIRRFDTDIIVTSFKPQPGLAWTVSNGIPGKAENLSDMRHQWFEDNGFELVAASNVSFFDYNYPGKPLGFYYHDGGYMLQPPSDSDQFTEMLFTKDNRMILEDLSLKEFKDKYEKDCYFGVAISYAIVIDGKRNYLNIENFSHAYSRHPRTWYGQKLDGTVVMFTCEGRNSNDKGLTVNHQYDISMEYELHNAGNGDGGGSAETVANIDDEIVILDYLEDGAERKLPSMLAVYAEEGNWDLQVVGFSPEKVVDLVIDPGHGGKDPGGGSNKYWIEKDFALEISLYMYQRALALGINTEMTRTTDVYVSLEDRGSIVKGYNARFCFSNHINAAYESADGFEIIKSIHNDGVLANKMAKAVEAEGQNVRRVFDKESTKYPGKDWYAMNRLTGATTTFIIEYGFATSNKDDVDQLRFQWKRYVEAILRVFCEELGKTYIAPEQVETKPNIDLDKIKEAIKLLGGLKLDKVIEMLSDAEVGLANSTLILKELTKEA